MECAVLKRFLKVQGTFLKKFLQTPLFHLEKIKFNFFIKALLKGFTPHPLRLRLSTFSTVEKALKPFRQATLATFPFRDGFRFGKAPMKGELSRSDWGVCLLPCGEGAEPQAKRMRGIFCLNSDYFPLICHLRDIFPTKGKTLKSQNFYIKHKFFKNRPQNRNPKP